MPRGNPDWIKGGTSPNQAGRAGKQERTDSVAVARRDGWIDRVAGHGGVRDRKLLVRYGVDVVTDIEAMQLWRSNWIARRVIEKRPSEAYRRGYELKLSVKDGKKRAEQVMAIAEGLKVNAALVKAAQFERAYGGAALLPVIDGAVGALREPLDPNTAITAVRAIHVLEPRQLHPYSYYEDLSHPKFGQPELWQFMPLNASRARARYGEIIHESRLIIYPGLRVSMQAQAGQREGWGENEVSACYEAMRDYGLSWANATTILQSFGRDVLAVEDLAGVLAQDGGESAMSRYLANFEMANSSLRLGVIDKKDVITARSSSLSGLADTLVQQAQYVAGACEMPLTVLMGMQPSGLNATGDMDVRNWYASIENDQSSKYKDPTEQVFSLLLRANGQQLEPNVWSIEFRPLMTPSEQEQAVTRKTTAETDQIYVDMKATTPVMVAKSRWGGDTYSAEMQVDISEIEQMEKEADDLAEKMAENAMLPGGQPVGSEKDEGDEDDDETKDEAAKERQG